MFSTAPLLSYSSTNTHDSWHNSLDYTWVSLGFDRLWRRPIVTWIQGLHTRSGLYFDCDSGRWWLFFLSIGRPRSWLCQSVRQDRPPRRRCSYTDRENTELPRRRVDNPGCCFSLCQTKNRSTNTSNEQLVFVFDDWPFQCRYILTTSHQPCLQSWYTMSTAR